MIYFNDASLHGQFPAYGSFNDSMRTIWEIRKVLAGKGLQLRVCRTVRTRNVTSEQTFNDFLGTIPQQLKTSLLLWLDREGPFWDDERCHSDGEYFECAGELVTDTGAAEAAYVRSEGIPTWLFSLEPSNFLSDPLRVEWRERASGDLSVDISNGWNLDHVERCTNSFEQPLSSWNELLEWAERECGNLILSPEVRIQLSIQFYPNVAQRSKVLLEILDRIVGLMKTGKVKEVEEIRREWMHGERARFSPSCDSELRDFANELTFSHPVSGRRVLCSWHGKIQTPQFRIHYEWPLPEGEERLLVAYIGPKITKR